MTFQTIPYPTNTVIIVICVTIVTQEQRGGLGYTPEMRLWISKRYASKTRLPPQNDDKQTRYPHKFVYALRSESLLIHSKILTRKSESVLIHLRFKKGIMIFSVI